MNKEVCRAPGCYESVHGDNYCKRHGMQIKKHGRLTPESDRGKNRVHTKCRETDCHAIVYKGNYCEAHYILKYSGHLPKGLSNIRHKCKERNCYALQFHEGYCRYHYSKLCKTGDGKIIINNTGW